MAKFREIESRSFNDHWSTQEVWADTDVRPMRPVPAHAYGDQTGLRVLSLNREQSVLERWNSQACLGNPSR